MSIVGGDSELQKTITVHPGGRCDIQLRLVDLDVSASLECSFDCQDIESQKKKKNLSDDGEKIEDQWTSMVAMFWDDYD